VVRAASYLSALEPAARRTRTAGSLSSIWQRLQPGFTGWKSERTQANLRRGLEKTLQQLSPCRPPSSLLTPVVFLLLLISALFALPKARAQPRPPKNEVAFYINTYGKVLPAQEPEVARAYRVFERVRAVADKSGFERLSAQARQTLLQGWEAIPFDWIRISCMGLSIVILRAGPRSWSSITLCKCRCCAVSGSGG
jgi:hypothetical protein